MKFRRYDNAAIFITLLLMPYALLRYAFDCLRGRG